MLWSCTDQHGPSRRPPTLFVMEKSGLHSAITYGAIFCLTAAHTWIGTILDSILSSMLNDKCVL